MVSEELTLEEAMDLSQYRWRNERILRREVGEVEI